MFAKALKAAQGFTRPVIISKRLFGGTVQSTCAAFVVLNDEGWILTSAHVLNDMRVAQTHAAEIAKYEQEVAAPGAGRASTRRQRKGQSRQVRANPQWITNMSYWWARDGATLTNIAIDDVPDLAVGRLTPFEKTSPPTYPSFKNPAGELAVGTPLCRLGFPFHAIGATFRQDTGTFELAQGVLPLTFFPLDGMHTRVVNMADPTRDRAAKFIEMSSPGLLGQSGGPVFDTEARVWGLQSRTMHMPLGFNPTVAVAGRNVVEHQFLNLGLATHVEEIARFLREKGVSFQLADG